jgi:hypothetical protein
MAISKAPAARVSKPAMKVWAALNCLKFRQLSGFHPSVILACLAVAGNRLGIGFDRNRISRNMVRENMGATKAGSMAHYVKKPRRP